MCFVQRKESNRQGWMGILSVLQQQDENKGQGRYATKKLSSLLPQVQA